MKLTGDYHTHTQYSDGQGSMEDIVRAALEKGLQEVAITDHGPANLLFPGREADFFSFKRELQTLQRKYPQIRLLMGVEANIISQEGELDISPALIQELDLLLVGLHLNIETGRGFTPFFKAKNLLHSYLSPHFFPRVLEINTGAVIKALTRYPVTILTHPGLHLHIATEAVAQVAAREGTWMELSARHKRVGVEYLQVVAQAGALLVVNSDAHHPREVGMVDSLYPLIKASQLPWDSFYNLTGNEER